MDKSAGIALLFFAVFLIGLLGCSDLGSAPPGRLPVIIAVTPPSAAAGDTITIAGSSFGELQGSSVVLIGGIAADTVISWSDTEIRVRIPVASNIGSVVVRVGGYESNAVSFHLQTASVPISFSANILPLFLQHGCYQCHGGSGGLIVHTVNDLLRGGQHGPAIVRGNADASVIIQKLSQNPPFGDRMPQGGGYLDSATVAVIRTWINQGAADN